MPAESGSVVGEQPSCVCGEEFWGSASACRSGQAAQAVLPWCREGEGVCAWASMAAAGVESMVGSSGEGSYCVKAAMASRVK